MNPESMLLEKISKEKLDEEIESKINSFHGLLNRETAIRILAKEHGLISNEEKFYKLSEVPKAGKKISVAATVKKIWPVATYNSGKQSRVVEITDSSASKVLILWNEDVEIAKNFRVGDELVVKGAYERNNELNLGYSGSVDVSKKSEFSKLCALNENGTIHLREVVSRIEGKTAIDYDNQKRIVFIFYVSDGESEKKCLIIEGLVRGEKLKVGDEVIIENAFLDSAKGVIELNDGTRMLSRRKEGMVIGVITKFEPGKDGMNLVMTIDEKELTLDRENALKLMNLTISDDIALSSVVTIKKDTLLNSKIAVKVEESSGRILVKR